MKYAIGSGIVVNVCSYKKLDPIALLKNERKLIAKDDLHENY